jgi:acyl-CoA reductase-like NAD-dependent aldehyde dehydrogenase
VLSRFHDVLYRRRHEVAEIVTRESGKPLTDALAVDVFVSLDAAAWTAAATPRFLRSSWRGVNGLLFWRKRVRFERKPLGVIGIIAPWNYPFFLPTACVLPAIATGNAVVLKPSEFTPGSAGILADLFREAGLPEGVLGIVQGDGSAGAALVRAGVDKVIFTGSVATGRKIAVACAEQLIPCSLELGGSDAAIVLADADVRHAADGIAWTRFANAGQTCVAPKRVYVEAAAHDAFVAAMATAVSALTVGAGIDAATEVGPMIHASAAAQLSGQRDDAIARGAQVAARAPLPDGGQVARAIGSPTTYFAPTVLTGVTDDMRVMREETFGPLLPVVRVADAEEAIRRANASEFGLSASVWTRDRARGLSVAKRLQAGTVLINDATSVVGMADVPYGGVKSSGLGRLHGEAGLAACVQETSIVDDRFATWHQPWWFRYGARHRALLEDYGRVAHGATLGERLRGLPGVVRLLLTKKGTR